MHPGQDSEPAFHCVTGNRLTHGFGYGQTQATMIRLVVMLFVEHQIMHDDIFATDFASTFQYSDKVTVAFQPFHLCTMPVALIAQIRRTGSCGPWRDGG
ncbi:hypothetical protein F7D08_0472 [Bifidobacterium cebidarum]|uniref:Uncharacterized protein n=1 Tax=Bifidobacterium cebidarum TaxID=2650773 RepID=A0A6I1GL73_9BIFI|nr:hypothetical protein F7D08_0472 [Bifidobacterium cebidarum]